MDMLKKILLIFLLFTGLAGYTKENYLNSIVLENTDGQNTVVLRTDETAKIKRDVESSDKIILTLKGIVQSPDITTLYKNTSNVKGLIIQNSKNNELKIFIQAPEISKADIIFDTPNSAPIVVRDAKGEERVVWSVLFIAISLFLMRTAKHTGSKQKSKDMNEILKEREKAMYRNFQKEVASMPGINYKLKSYKKHVLKGETLRHYTKV